MRDPSEWLDASIEQLTAHVLGDDRSLAGQHCFVTGSARGMGEQTVRGLAFLGAKVTAVDMHPEGQVLVDGLIAEGHSVKFVCADIADAAALRGAYQIACDTFGPPDIVLNNAVHFEIQALLDVSPEAWERTINTNLRAALLLYQLALPAMLKRRRGAFCSMLALEGMAWAGPMSATKVALRSMVISLAGELPADAGVSVFGFAPGLVDTPLVHEVFPQYCERLGLTFETYVDQHVSNPGYPGLQPVPHAAVAIIHALSNAEQHHSLFADPFMPLRDAGIIEDGVPKARGSREPSDNVNRLRDYIDEIRRMNEAIEKRIAVRTRELDAERAENARLIETLEARNTQLAEARVRAELGADAKTAFVARMSHEIRTPLNGIIGMSSLMAGEEMSPAAASRLMTIRTSSEALLRIVNDVLDFSKMEAGKLRLESEAFDPIQCAEDVVGLLSPLARAKALELGVVVNPDVPDKVVGDAGRVRQVLTNLLGNAIKFTQAGSVRIDLDMHPPGHLSFFVQDTGCGFDPADLNRLFTAFEQAETDEQVHGTGLGLAVSLGLAEQMGGSLVADSAPGQGSFFAFSIPVESDAACDPLSSCVLEFHGGSDLAREALISTVTRARLDAEIQRELGGGPLRFDVSETGLSAQLRTKQGAAISLPLPASRLEFATALGVAPPLASPELQDSGRLATARVLIVEDNPVNQRVCQQMLDRLGYDCVLVADGAEAVDQVALVPFDLVLMDCNMPRMDGWEATAKIRTLGIKQPPIVGVTAGVLPDEVQRCLSCGMDEVLTKPYTVQSLGECVRRWAGRIGGCASAAASATHSPPV